VSSLARWAPPGADRGAGDSHGDDVAGADRAEGRRSRTECGPGGRDVVDEQYGPAGPIEPGAEPGGLQALGAGAAGLRTGVLLSDEEPSAWETELTREMAGDELGLVESALAATGVPGGGPGDDVDVDSGAHPSLDQSPAHETSEMPRHSATVVELETEQHRSGPTGERDRHQHSGTSRRSAEQREATRRADGGTGGVASGAPDGEHRGEQGAQGDPRAATGRDRRPIGHQSDLAPGGIDSVSAGSGRVGLGACNSIEHVFSFDRGCDTRSDRATDSGRAATSAGPRASQ